MTPVGTVSWAKVDGPGGASSSLPEFVTTDTTLDETDALIATVTTSAASWSVECAARAVAGGDTGSRFLVHGGVSWNAGAAGEWLFRMIFVYSDTAAANALEVSAKYGSQDATYMVAQNCGALMASGITYGSPEPPTDRRSP